MKKIMVAGLLVSIMCFLAACSQDKSIENAQEQVITLQGEANNAVENYNEQVQDMDEAAQDIQTE